MINYKKTCGICGENFKTGHYKNTHLRNVHNLEFDEYILKMLYNGIHPTCKCGCGTKTNWDKDDEFGNYYKYIRGHYKESRPHTEESKKKISETNKKTCMERYGTNSVLKLPSVRDKIKKTAVERYGVEHVMKNEEIQQRLKDGMMRKYGVETPMHSKIIKEKVKLTNIERWGFDNPSKNKEVSDKRKKTMIEKYGAKTTGECPILLEKMKRTNLINNGVEYPAQNSEIYKNVKATMLERYGFEHSIQNPEIYKKVKDTMLERYGETHSMKIDMFKEKSKNTMIERYGVENIFLSKDYKKNHNPKISKIELEICEILNGESSFNYKGKKYDIKVGNNLYEIDGDFFHSDKLQDLNLITLGTITNDFIKIEDILKSPYNLHKIFISNLPKEITEYNLQKNSYIPNFELGYEDVIVSKEYLNTLIEKKGVRYIEKYFYYFRKYIEVFRPNLMVEFENKNIVYNSIKETIGIGKCREAKDFSIYNIVENIQRINN